MLKTRAIFLLFSCVFPLSYSAYSINVSWDGGGDGTSWSDPMNWNPNIVPANGDDITIDCSCTISNDSDLIIDGSLTITSGTILDMGAKKLEIGKNDNIGVLVNDGTITNSGDVKVKGDGLAGEGPFITNSGTITTETFHVGNNNGGGKLTNTSSGIVNIIDLGSNAVHVDGTICNAGTINVTNEVLFHGAVLTCGGIFNAPIIKLEDNPQSGGGGSGAGSDIQSQSFSDGAGCTGASSSSLIYVVSGGVGGGPNGDDTYTYQELLDEFGTTDTNSKPQFMVDPVLVTSCGESASGDVTPPTIVNMPNDTAVYAPDDACDIPVSWTAPVITDNVGVQSVTITYNPGDIFPVGITTVTYTANDAATNSTSASFDITVLDTISPTVNNLPSDITQNADAGACGAIVNWTQTTVADNCSASLSSSHNPGDFFIVGITTVTYTALDIHGNSTVQTFDVTINDNIPPAIVNMPSDITQDADAGACGAIVNWTLPTAADNCSASISSDYNSGDVFPVGTTTVTYTALDVDGNSTVLTFDVTINDNIPPTIVNMPADITQNADAGACGAIVNWTLPTTADNCSASLSSSHNPGDFFNVGTTTVTYTALDIQGNSTGLTFDVTIIDNLPPVINNLPTDITQNADAGTCGAIVNWTQTTVADNCSASLSSSHNPGDFFIVGITTVTYTALDIHGNSTVLTFAVTIIDNIPPAINNVPADIAQNTDVGVCGAIVNWTLPTATDNCSASLSSNHNPGDFFAVGTTTVTYTALDVHGNSSIQNFNVTVEDKNGPEFTDCPSSFTVESIDTLSNKASISWIEPTATDPCSSVTMSSNYKPGDTFDLGKTTVIYTAIDQQGNETQCNFEVESGYNRAPVVNHSARKTTAGESIQVIIDAHDPDGDQIFIDRIKNNENNSFVSDIDFNNLAFVYTSLESYYGNDTVQVTIADNATPSNSVLAKVIIEVERKSIVVVSSAITTNGDMINDYWHLANIDLFPNNWVYIYDRWGGLIFQTSGYNNNAVRWNGNINQKSMGNQTIVSTGTYFYVIDLGNGNEKLTGAVEVIQ